MISDMRSKIRYALRDIICIHSAMLRNSLNKLHLPVTTSSVFCILNERRCQTWYLQSLLTVYCIPTNIRSFLFFYILLKRVSWSNILKNKCKKRALRMNTSIIHVSIPTKVLRTLYHSAEQGSYKQALYRL